MTDGRWQMADGRWPSVLIAHWPLVILLVLMAFTAVACAPEMHIQPAFNPQEAPRRMPPEGAVPVLGAEPSYAGTPGRELQNPVKPDQISVERGKALFAVNCQHCHGAEGQGNGPVASYFATKGGAPPDLTADVTQSKPDGQLFWYVTEAPGNMPAFRKFLRAEERWDIVNYLRALGGGVPSPASGGEAPPPQSPGQAVFEANCSACHNLTAERKVGPGLAGLFGRPQLPNGQPANGDSLREWITTGGGGMPPISVTNDELTVLIEFLGEATALP